MVVGEGGEAACRAVLNTSFTNKGLFNTDTFYFYRFVS